MTSLTRRRLPILALAGLSLLAGLWAGVIRLGWILPSPTSGLVAGHGPLMVTGFLGTLIGLERAAALKRPWAYGAPLAAGLSAIALLAGLPDPLTRGLGVAAGLFLGAIFLTLYRRDPSGFLATLGVGALVWAIGSFLWLAGQPLFRVVPWWVGFLVLTIAGERLELSRLLRLSGLVRAAFFLAIGIVLLGLAGLFAFEAGTRVVAVGLTALALWLFTYDIAWRNLRREGLPRYMGICLLFGYLWLLAGGVLWGVFGEQLVAGAVYDAMLHSIFLGFVFSMIFAHAPVILPGVLRLELPFHPAFYAHWALLHLSLLLRVGGDLALWADGARWGGLVNVLAILLFLVNSIRAALMGLRARTRPEPSGAWR